MTQNDSKYIVISGLSKTFNSDSSRPIKAINSIDLTIEKNEIVCVLGPSGCGKSTLLNIIAGIIETTSGKVSVFGYSPVQAKSKITYIQQKPHLLPYRSVYSNAALGLELRNELNTSNLKRIKELLQFLGLTEFLSNYPSELSGGMQQRVALARTLAIKAPLVLCDEPLSSLDFENRMEIENFFWHECKNEGKTSIFVTHQIDSAVALADRIVVLSPRPGSVFEIITVNTELSKLSPRERREHPDFPEQYAATWRAIRESINHKGHEQI